MIDFAADEFAQAVTKPAFLAKRGEPRVRALFEKWLRWRDEGSPAGGCFFVAASAELDDREGAARDRLVALGRLGDALAHAVRIAISEGHFPLGSPSRAVRLRDVRRDARDSSRKAVAARSPSRTARPASLREAREPRPSIPPFPR